MFKKLLENVGKYKRDSLLSPFYVVLEIIMEVLIPFLMAKLIDLGIEKQNMSIIYKIGGILVLSTILSLIFGALAGKYAASASAGFGKNLRKNMYYKIQDFSFKNIDKFSTASIVTRLTTDVTNIQNSYQMIIRIAVRGPVMIVFSMIMAFGVNKRLSLVILALIPILGIGLYLIISNVHPIFKKVFGIYDNLNRVVQENLKAIRVVKAYVKEDFEKEKFNKISFDIFKEFSKAEKILALNGPLIQFCMYACVLLLSWFGAKSIVSESMTTGELTSLIFYAAQILMSLMMFSMVFVMITISRSSAERIVEILEEKTEIIDKKDGIKIVKNGNIKFENVGFSYTGDQNKLCLDSVNLEIKSGETIGIIGGTGSSKTSLVQLIPRLYDVTEGSLKVAEVDVIDYDMETLRHSVAMVLQKNILFSGTIRENLLWGNKNAKQEDLEKACKLAVAHEFIMSFPDGYNTYLEQEASNLSGGQKQRLCIARALLKEPKILILDDSTSAVDTKTDALIRMGLKNSLPDTTKIIIAQRISSIEDADKIIVMDNGKINQIGTHKKLLESNSIYQEVYDSQVKGGMHNE